MEDYIEKMMEQLNSGESKTVFKNISCFVIICLTTSGRKPWQEDEETRKDTSIVLIRQEQSCTQSREPEVPEERVPVVECLDGHARITSKELAPIHSVKSSTFQSACSTRPRVVADLVKSALMHIVRLMNGLAKGPKRTMTRVQ